MEPFRFNSAVFLLLLLVALSFLSEVFPVNYSNALSQCLQAESSALLQLKRGFTSGELQAWRPGTDCCTWEGVTCDDESRRVIYLDLHNRSIAGKIDPSLFNLTSLRTLNFGDNQFDQIPIPDFGWDRLANLSSLYLYNAGFVGKVPVDISRLSKLTVLDLSDNYGLSLTTNPLFFQNMSSLRELSLDNVNISAYGDEWCGALVNSTRVLEWLSCRGCSLFGGFPKQIFQLRNLKYLIISNNSMLSGPLPDFPKDNNLEGLAIFDTNFCGNLPDTIGNLKFLTQLDLSNNNFSGVAELEFIKDLKNLEYLDLSYSGFSFSSWDADDGSSWSFNFSKMSDLLLAGCNLTKIPAFIKYLHGMYQLDLSNNRIHGEIPRWIWSIGELNLSCNFFSHVAEPSFNLSTYHFSLNIIDLHSNMLEGQIPHLPPIDFVYLDLSNNRFTSSIPSNIFSHLNSTRMFSLAKNSLIGEIPPFIYNLTELMILDLSNNRLTGSIPPTICNLIKLQMFDLSNNMLGGSIPPCLFQQGINLNLLNLRGNQLHGAIPNEINPKCELQTINLRDNQLQGLLPRSLSNCRSLMILDLRNNNLKDTFPYWLGNMSSLRVLILGSNKFHGLVGPPNGNHELNYTFPMLHVFDISSNNFCGNLCAECFSNFKSMMVNKLDTTNNFLFNYLGYYYDMSILTIMNKGQLMTIQKFSMIVKSIDLSNNLFEGEIPTTIGQLVSLQVLNMSHNYLTSEIPPQLGKLSQLESLDLSMNSLSGKIPQELVSLYFLSVLNLSYNKLVGKIPLGGQFCTFSNTSFEGNEGLHWLPCNTLAPVVNNTSTSPPGLGDTENRSYMIVLGILFGMGVGVGMATVVVLDVMCYDKCRRKRSRRYVHK